MIKKTILITGCSSGIGYDTAIALTKRGHKVIASCRKLVDVERLRALGLEAIRLDVTDEQSIDEGFEQLLNMTCGRLDVLINNAGYGQAGALEDVPRDALVEQFNTNVFGLLSMTQRAIWVMRRQGHGRIINISSILGLISLPLRGAYNASKYAVEGLSDTLRLELKPAGIHVITIEPGPIESQFRKTAVDASLKHIAFNKSHFQRQYQSMITDFQSKKTRGLFTLKPDAVIRKLIHAIESDSPKRKYLVTFPAYLFMVLKRCLSVGLLDRILSFVSRQELSR